MVLQETVAPVAPKDPVDLQDAEDLQGLLVIKVVMVLQVKVDLQDPLASQATRALLEILVQLVPGETRDRTGYLDLLGRKEPWELLELDLEDQKGTKVNQGVLEKRVLLDPVGLRVHVGLQETQAAPGLPDPLVLLDVLARTASASKELKETEEFLEGEDPKVLLVVVVLPVLLVRAVKEIKDVKDQQVPRDHLVAPDTLDPKAVWAEMEHQVHLDTKA